MKPSIELIWIVVSDLKKAVDYYTKVLGFEAFVVEEKFGWAEVGSKTGARLGLAQSSPQSEIPAGGNAVITFTVADLEASKAELLKKGVTFMGDTQEITGHVKMQMIRDESGNHLQMVELLSEF